MKTDVKEFLIKAAIGSLVLIVATLAGQSLLWVAIVYFVASFEKDLTKFFLDKYDLVNKVDK